MQVFDVLDHLDHTFAVELDRRRRIRRVSRSVAALDGRDAASYRGRRPEDLWEVPEEARRASHACLRTGEVQRGYEIWTAATGAQRVVQVARIPSRGGVVVVGEDVTEILRHAALNELGRARERRLLPCSDRLQVIAPALKASDCTPTDLVTSLDITIDAAVSLLACIAVGS